MRRTPVLAAGATGWPPADATYHEEVAPAECRQLGLFALGEPEPDRSFTGLERTWLTDQSWIDHQPSWLAGSDEVCATLIDRVSWRQGRRRMYERVVDEPRLNCWLGRTDLPFPHPVIAELFDALSTHYGVVFDSVGINYYRDGNDSVAWHGDRIARTVPEPVIALVSVGEPRPFLLRPKGGGESICHRLGAGDLLVMGGRCQQELDHCVPKVRVAGPRISLGFRHAEPPAAPG